VNPNIPAQDDFARRSRGDVVFCGATAADPQRLDSCVSIGSLALALWAIWIGFLPTPAVPGWASTVVPIYFLGGVQLLCIGIIGEYLAKTYIEVKGRPRFFIERVLGSVVHTSERAARAREPTDVEDDAPAAPIRWALAYRPSRRAALPNPLDPRWPLQCQALGNPGRSPVFQRFRDPARARPRAGARSARDPRTASRAVPFRFICYGPRVVRNRPSTRCLQAAPVAYVTHGIEAAWSYAVLEDLPIGAHLTSPRRVICIHGVYAGNGKVIHYGGFNRMFTSNPVEEVSFEEVHPRTRICREALGRAEVFRCRRGERARSRIGEDSYRCSRTTARFTSCRKWGRPRRPSGTHTAREPFFRPRDPARTCSCGFYRRWHHSAKMLAVVREQPVAVLADTRARPFHRVGTEKLRRDPGLLGKSVSEGELLERNFFDRVAGEHTIEAAVVDHLAVARITP